MSSITQLVYLLFLSTFLFGCVITSVDYSMGKPYLLKNQGMLIEEMPNSYRTGYNSTIDYLKDELEGKFSKILYKPSIEYELKNAGMPQSQIDSVGLDTKISQRASDILGITYLLKVELIKNYSGLICSSRKSLLPPEPPSEVQYFFRIIDLTALTVSSGFIVSANTLRMPDRRGNLWDFGIFIPMQTKSLKKGVKVIKKAIE